MNIEELFTKRYLDNFKYSLDVGVEIEMPLVNLEENHIVDSIIVQGLFKELERLKFIPCNYDKNGDVIATKSLSNGDTISLEYSLNTLEFSLDKEKSIFELEAKFNKYYNFIQEYLKKYNYSLHDGGINPYYKQINKTCLSQKRYKAIEYILTSDVKDKLYGQFCAYCCSIQTHINVNRESLAKVFNLFTYINPIKEELFANSYMSEIKLKNSRKYLWQNSNFGPFNVGKNKYYKGFDDILEDYLDRRLFFVERDNQYFILKENLSLKKYFEKDKVVAFDINGKECFINPLEKDLDNFRSYKDIEISKYGTLEIRTDCMQKISDIFKVVAFNVGIYENMDMVMKIIKEKGNIEKNELIKLSQIGLSKRNLNEEKILYGKELKM